MDPILATARLLDTVSRAVGFVRLSPTRRARAAVDGFSPAFQRRIDWGMSGAGLESRLGRGAPCGCRVFRGTVTLYDIECTVHDVLGTAGPGAHGLGPDDGDADDPTGWDGSDDEGVD